MIPLALRVLGWLRSNPLAALCLILALWAGVERHSAHKWHDRAEQCRTASQAAAEAQKALRDAETRQSKEKAVEVDKSHTVDLAAVRDATAAYIASHRVRSPRISAPVAIDQASGPGLPAPVPAAVVVVEADVRTCADLYAYSTAAHNWAVTVGQ